MDKNCSTCLYSARGHKYEVIEAICRECDPEKFTNWHPDYRSMLTVDYKDKWDKCAEISEYAFNRIREMFEKKGYGPLNDQAVKADAGKPKLTLVPRQILFDVARVREYGNNKYPDGGVDNWKNVDVQRYRDAAFRHFVAYLNNPYGTDEESGLPHLWHLACNIAFLCEMEKDGYCLIGAEVKDD